MLLVEALSLSAESYWLTAFKFVNVLIASSATTQKQRCEAVDVCSKPEPSPAVTDAPKADEGDRGAEKEKAAKKDEEQEKKPEDAQQEKEQGGKGAEEEKTAEGEKAADRKQDDTAPVVWTPALQVKVTNYCVKKILDGLSIQPIEGNFACETAMI